MTEAAQRRTRWPKGRVRALAWGTSGAAFIMAAAPLVAAPKPSADTATNGAKRAPARHVIEKHITRRVIIVDPVATAPTYTGGSSGGQITANVPAAAAPAPPVTSSGGS